MTDRKRNLQSVDQSLDKAYAGQFQGLHKNMTKSELETGLSDHTWMKLKSFMGNISSHEKEIKPEMNFEDEKLKWDIE